MADSSMYAKSGGEWIPVYPEPVRGAAPVLSAAPDATQIVYTWTAATGITPASYELDFNGVIENVGNVLTFTKTGLTTGQSYTARVRAKTAENVRGEWSNLLNTVAAVPYNVATGGTVTDVPNYNGTGETWRVHSFTASGNFVVTAAPQPFKVLLVGGGGNGSSNAANPAWELADGESAGGGGGGGVIANDSLTIAAGTHSVTVGAAAQNTTAFSLTAFRGGNGGTGGYGGAAGEGGSQIGGGGGGGGTGGAPKAGGVSTSGQGNNGSYQTGGSAVISSSNITGTVKSYGIGSGGNGGAPTNPFPAAGEYGRGGWNANKYYNTQYWYTAGSPGVVIVAYRIA